MLSIAPESLLRIEAYKIDLFISDAIAFDLYLSDGSIIFSCEEHDEWKSVEAFVKTLPLLDPDWEGKVAFPAFEERRMLIYDKNTNP